MSVILKLVLWTIGERDIVYMRVGFQFFLIGGRCRKQARALGARRNRADTVKGNVLRPLPGRLHCLMLFIQSDSPFLVDCMYSVRRFGIIYS